eukprot:GHVP01023171.1.p1 GENE.GHVP01023171.1~~GHVP01023171.1.p1  ORF type:complete len:289 (-),score=38.27 GHVP01023171.1:105-971(-)
MYISLLLSFSVVAVERSFDGATIESPVFASTTLPEKLSIPFSGISAFSDIEFFLTVGILVFYYFQTSLPKILFESSDPATKTDNFLIHDLIVPISIVEGPFLLLSDFEVSEIPSISSNLEKQGFVWIGDIFFRVLSSGRKELELELQDLFRNNFFNPRDTRKLTVVVPSSIPLAGSYSLLKFVFLYKDSGKLEVNSMSASFKPFLLPKQVLITYLIFLIGIEIKLFSRHSYGIFRMYKGSRESKFIANLPPCLQKLSIYSSFLVFELEQDTLENLVELKKKMFDRLEL